MTTPQVRDASQGVPGDEPIADYLREHPDFFVRNEALLALLRLPHARGGSTVSLMERQVEVLREKNQQLESKLAEFVGVARTNEQLVEKIHRFTRRLLNAANRHEAISQIEQSLREDFGAFQSVLVLFGGGALDIPADRFVTVVDGKDPGLAGFETLFSAGKPRCGQVRDSQREFLFGTESIGISSLALVPLGGKEPLGLLAIGSPDRDRFNPGMSTEFLARMGELIGDVLARP
jgi:uncharacterized protein YigA (DUF484 family)